MLNNTITTIGSALYDVMFYTDEAVLTYNPTDILRQRLISFEYGAKIYSKDAHFVGGGSAANVAVTFANLGIKTQIISAVGNDFLGSCFNV
jgi:sugar/nucleoside kinase (ribokinase family)